MSTKHRSKTEQKRIEEGKDKCIREAVLDGDHKLLAELLSTASFDMINTEYLKESALDQAVSKDDEVAVEMLLAHGAIPDYKHTWPVHIWTQSTLSRAIMNGNYKIIRLLLNKGCDLNTEIDFFCVRYDKQDDWTIPLIIPINYWYKIVKMNCLNTFQFLLKCENRKIVNDQWYQKLLYLACCLGSDDIVEYLLDQGVSIESTDDNGWTCIFHAVFYQCVSIIALLLRKGSNLKHKDIKGRSVLHVAAEYQKGYNPLFSIRETVIHMLVHQGADINATDINGLTPINIAITDAKTDDINQFIIANQTILILISERYIDFAKPDNNGVTFLHRAVSVESLPLYQDILCAVDVDINARDNMGRTPLQSINNFKAIKNISLMLELGADSKDLYYYSKNDWLENKEFLKVLESYRLKRKVANLSNDLIVDTILGEKCVLSVEERAQLIEKYSEEIEKMKETIFYDKLTYYDFLHAEKCTYIGVAEKPEIREIFTRFKHKFDNYQFILCKNYVSTVRLVTAYGLDGL